MAGGEGTRLRPMTATMPKPLLPVVNRPIMEHVLRLLKRHGIDETVVTVQFLATLVRNYFGDGDELGMALQYASEDVPLGTAGSVKNAEAELRDDAFVVISGDALTDVDLTALVKAHRDQGALVTVALKRVADPVEFGIVITDESGRIDRFLAKPTWGQVFSDTVNTGIYVMEPEVFRHVEAGLAVDWSADVFPKLLADGAPLFGYITDSYWEDVGTHESYVRAQADVLDSRVEVEIDGFQVSPGVWVGEGAEIDPDATLRGPVYVGDYAKVEAGAEVSDYTVLGSNVVVRGGAVVQRSVVHDNVFIGSGATLRGAVVGRGTDVMHGARLDEQVVVGDGCTIEPEAVLSQGVRVYPSKTVEAGAVVQTSVIWESRAHRSLFGARGVSGTVNVEITPELVVRLASAYATTVRKGSVVTVSRDAGRPARALDRAVVSALTASTIEVLDLDVLPTPIARYATARSAAVGGFIVRTAPGDAQSVDILVLDEGGADLSQSARRKLERVFVRQEFRRAFPGEIADATTPARLVESYVQDLVAAVGTTGIAEAGLRVVVDAAAGTAAGVLPAVLGGLGVDALTVGGRLDPDAAAETLAKRMTALERLGGLVASSGAAFGVRFDPTGERLTLVDETGAVVPDDRALLVVTDLVAAERRHGVVALPVTQSRIAEQVAAFHGVSVRWTPTAPEALPQAAALPEVILAGDGRGGYVVPGFSPSFDAVAAFALITGLVARTRLALSQIDGRIPATHVLRRRIRTPWSTKGQVMRAVVEAAAGRQVDTTDGVRVIESDGSWILVLPDPSEAVTHLSAEGPDRGTASDLIDRWSALVEGAAR
ncbi:MAG: mannose-phosphate guanylyltransferase / phosphomannomutase [Frankiales bacterium]|nr:mannose-phosphate guanylyltransferase / phosphomannomutase [Frankiales bacterium]